MIYEVKETCLVFFENFRRKWNIVTFMIFSFQLVMELPFNLRSETESNQVMGNIRTITYTLMENIHQAKKLISFQLFFYLNFRDTCMIHT